MTWREVGGFLIASAMTSSIVLMVLFQPEFVAFVTRAAPMIGAGIVGGLLTAAVIFTTEQRK